VDVKWPGDGARGVIGEARCMLDPWFSALTEAAGVRIALVGLGVRTTVRVHATMSCTQALSP